VLHAEGFKAVMLFLVVAGILVPLLHRFRISTVLGFLIAGMALGPFGLGRMSETYPWLHYVTFDNPQRGEPLAELGIICLLFLLGLELSLERLWQLKRYVLGVGAVQVIATTLAIGLILRVSGAVPPSGLVLGLCLALSSTAIVMPILAEQHRVASPLGRISLSVLLFQDLMVVPILFTVGMLAGGGTGGFWPLAILFAQAAATVAAILLLGRYVFGPLLRSAVRTGSRDLIMAITLLIVIGISAATSVAGLSGALGAFMAGLLLSDSEYRHHIEVDLEPFKGLLLGIFFVTVGTSIDLRAVVSDFGWIVLGLAALILVKATITFVTARLFGVERGSAIELALLLAQAGEFAFVVITLAQRTPLLSPRLATAAVAVAGLSMMVTPLLAYAARQIAQRMTPPNTDAPEPGPDTDEFDQHVVIGGFGRVGQTIAALLEREHVSYIALDADPMCVAAQRRAGRAVYFGDAGRAEILARAGAARARAFVVTLDTPNAAERMVKAARMLRPDVPVLARAKDATHAARLLQLGAVDPIPEAIEASLQLAGRLLEALDVPEDAVAQSLATARTDALGSLAAAPSAAS
jgi:CPA2 family monovalent cation:H+ antiporter-2